MTLETEIFAANANRTIVGRPCPRYPAINAKKRLPQQGYTCQQCGIELTYLDYTATEGVRQAREVLGRGGFCFTYLVSKLRLNGRRRTLTLQQELAGVSSHSLRDSNTFQTIQKLVKNEQ